MSDDIVIRLTKLPPGIKGFVSPSNDGVYNIYVDATLAVDQQKKSSSMRSNI